MNAIPPEHEARGGALSGVRVLDLSAYLAGPYACTLLSDLGATVIKVEPPTGDNSRSYPSSLKAAPRGFLGLNRGKKGLVLDLKTDEGVALLHRLAASADVLVHNFRPGVAERLRIDFATLSGANPRLVYCHLTGYGKTGPLSQQPGFDQVLQTFSGICDMQGGPNAPPQIVNGSIVDYSAAYMMALGIASALFHRERTGQGQEVDVSLLGSALAMQSARLVHADAEARDAIKEFGSGGITGLHSTRDGWLYLSANTPHFWCALCEITGLEDVARDPRYDTIRKRAAAADELVPKVRAALMARSALEWEALFAERVPGVAARNLLDMFEHPQVLAQGMIGRFDYPGAGSYRAFQNPLGFSASPCPPAFGAPALGQHSQEVLAEIGVEAAEFDRLRQAGVVGTAPSI